MLNKIKINKTLSTQSWERNKKNSSQIRRVVFVPVVVEPVVVRVPLLAVPVEIANVEVAVRVAVCV